MVRAIRTVSNLTPWGVDHLKRASPMGPTEPQRHTSAALVLAPAYIVLMSYLFYTADISPTNHHWVFSILLAVFQGVFHLWAYFRVTRSSRQPPVR
jgi:hypothetical protein